LDNGWSQALGSQVEELTLLGKVGGLQKVGALAVALTERCIPGLLVRKPEERVAG